MRTRGFLALLMGAALAAGACGPGEDTTLDDLDERSPMTDTAPPSAGLTDRTDQMATGTLGKVDPDARTFTLNTGSGERTFRYGDDTDVTGVPSIQGLAGREGSRVTVYYRDDAGSMMATRITIAEGAGTQPSSSPSGAQQPPGSQPGTPQPGQQR